MRFCVAMMVLLTSLLPAAADASDSAEATEKTKPELQPIVVSKDGTHFVTKNTQQRFVPWGFNYDHDAEGRLIEDYLDAEWETVEQDFAEMKTLGANVVRLHLQVGKFVESRSEMKPAALKSLKRIVTLAEETGLYLNITGLGCYHRSDVPTWYDALSEKDRWSVQAMFWESVAQTCSESPAIFCYDLMNEPILPGKDKAETEWLTGNLGGKFFVQRITLDLRGRSRKAVAKAWIDSLVRAIRKSDPRHMITVGVIPWAHVFPKAKPLFHDPEVGRALDFVSVHFYPRSGEVDKALAAIKQYDIGKPIVVEEMFPLKCSADELGEFIDGAESIVDGWFGFYWGMTEQEYKTQKAGIKTALMLSWLKFFRERAARMTQTANAKRQRQVTD